MRQFGTGIQRGTTTMGRWPLLGLLLLAGCASGQPNPAPLPPDLQAARQTLLGSSGPIPMTVENAPAALGPDASGTVARLASDATAWAAAGFSPVPTGQAASQRVVMRFGESGGDACRQPAPAAGPAAPERLTAALCDGTRTVAESVGIGTTADRISAERLVSETTQRLFPRLGGNETSTSGWSAGAPGVWLGGAIGSGGGSGAGIGIGF